MNNLFAIIIIIIYKLTIDSSSLYCEESDKWVNKRKLLS